MPQFGPGDADTYICHGPTPLSQARTKRRALGAQPRRRSLSRGGARDVPLGLLSAILANRLREATSTIRARLSERALGGGDVSVNEGVPREAMHISTQAGNSKANKGANNTKAGDS